MTNQRPRADVVIVGLGWAGSVMAEELTRAGLEVVAIERGAWRDTSTDFPPAIQADELRWHTRRGMLQPMSVETTTFRNTLAQTAAPVRNWSAFQYGWHVGGAGAHWAGMSWRFLPWDFQVATQTMERYGASKMEGLQLHDWGVTYEDMEPYYDRFERIAGSSGIAGNLNGERRAGGNVFEGPRSREYPTPPLKDTHWMRTYRETTEGMGYHPFTIPAGNISQAYVNPLGVAMGPCTYCGFCDFHGCGNFSKSSPQACILPVLMRRPNFTLLTNTEVLHAVKHQDGKTAKAGKGTVGRNYTYQTCSTVSGFFTGQKMNPFIGGGALAVQIDDFNGDNFDHSGLDFIGGSGLMGFSTNGPPIQNMNGLRPGTKRWGSEWKAGYARDYNEIGTIFCQGTSMPVRDAYIDLDPTYKDRHGQPLMRLTFDWNRNDIAMNRYVTDRAVEIMREAGGEDIMVDNQSEESGNPTCSIRRTRSAAR